MPSSEHLRISADKPDPEGKSRAYIRLLQPANFARECYWDMVPKCYRCPRIPTPMSKYAVDLGRSPFRNCTGRKQNQRIASLFQQVRYLRAGPHIGILFSAHIDGVASHTVGMYSQISSLANRNADCADCTSGRLQGDQDRTNEVRKQQRKKTDCKAVLGPTLLLLHMGVAKYRGISDPFRH